MTTIKQLLIDSSNYLKSNNISDYRLEAEILLSYLLNLSKEELYLSFDKRISSDKGNTYLELLERRANKKEPLQYIINRVEFFGVEFYINKHCFIPRAETEILVETALKTIYSFSFTSCPLFLDLGCGCGNIAIVLAKNIDNCRIIAVDISLKAIEVAKFNAKLNKVSDKIEFVVSDMLTSFNTKFDLIISNPPYIREGEIKNLQKEIMYEPIIAIDGGEDGLVFYKMILSNIEHYLKKDSSLICEFGNNRDGVYELFRSKFRKVEIVKDYSNHDRVIIGSELQKLSNKTSKITGV